MSFEDILDKEKNNTAQALFSFGEGKRVGRALDELEANRPEFYRFYKAGQKSKADQMQAKIDRLMADLLKAATDQAKLHMHCQELEKQIKEMEPQNDN
ncbi:hypothetical protein EC844_12557 [Acinetobacter calcoaceticus]|uniref:Uncharacterized protein n=1 Tax=Acinetobacter calcoaceticus TaxID=471 RepID=A0A4R1XGR4_ACICA|nr:hypothetical protein EC844_12557 [Acinetobacter calcoaceticus]